MLSELILSLVKQSRSAIFVAGLLAAGAVQAAPADVWPTQPTVFDPKTVDAAAVGLPASLQPAVKFQKLYLQILGGAPVTAWREPMQALANAAANDPVAQGVQQAARAWLARAVMTDLDAGLREYYKHKARFPEALEQAAKYIPDKLRVDPWGDPWMYSLHAPFGFNRETTQRYSVAPKRLPQLTPLKAAIKNRPSPALAWKISPREIAGQKALEFFSPIKQSNALIQPGSTIDDRLLLFIGDRWALLGAVDQLFAVTY